MPIGIIGATTVCTLLYIIMCIVSCPNQACMCQTALMPIARCIYPLTHAVCALSLAHAI